MKQLTQAEINAISVAAGKGIIAAMAPTLRCLESLRINAQPFSFPPGTLRADKPVKINDQTVEFRFTYHPPDSDGGAPTQ